jgi:hypothetical protein
VFAAARDVTERKHIEKMLQEKNLELETPSPWPNRRSNASRKSSG